jgi:hypothetical protein
VVAYLEQIARLNGTGLLQTRQSFGLPVSTIPTPPASR